MSEEAVRQTRSQKRALEREETANKGNEHKKPKLDILEPASQTQTKCYIADSRDSLSEQDNEHKEELHQDIIAKTSLSLVLPLDCQQAKNEQPHLSQRPKEEASSDRTRCTNSPSELRRESASDTRTSVKQIEPNVTGQMLAADEVEATIKVEVQATDQPVDMTKCKGIKREKWPPSLEDDDVIILSDNDSPGPTMNGLSHLNKLDTKLLMKSSAKERERIIKQLKEELRLEEAKLVLLKKLRQNQIQRDTIHKASSLTGCSAPPPLIQGTIGGSKSSQQILTGRNCGTVIPLPLMRDGQQISKHSSQVTMPPLVKGTQQIQALRQQQQQQQQIAAGNSSSGPPPLLLGPRTSAPASQRNLVQSGLIRVGNNVCALGSSTMKGSGSGLSVISVNDSPASRQAAAKLFNFLPSAANNEFIYLVGLEEVVQNLLDTFHKGKMGYTSARLVVQDPLICTQCKTDFTCRWRKEKTTGGVVFCEDCMSSNLKKGLKAEHTNRLKAAFVKALQQEQEIDQCIIQASSTGSYSSSVSLKTEHLVSQQLKHAQPRVSSLHQHHQSSRGANLVHHRSIKQSSHGQLSHGMSSVSARGIPHSFSSSSQLQSAVAAAALVSRPGVTMAYINPSLTGHKTSASVDARQREYLLDMIPSRSSISQTANTWK
ncbi:hypothetical protein WMY93_001453 [Mugilogobius chulae]|uniref:Transcriptional repressor p66 coiled-coil MBD2-interaction domain-containing protein n=1 Tax=Mugilogobius chulae TaxID=88201 RepID=A0AAW0QC78_9GOBI